MIVAKLQAEMRNGDHVMPAGSLVAYEIEVVLAGNPAEVELVLTAPENGAIENVAATRTGLLVTTTEHIAGRVHRLTRDDTGQWHATMLDLPGNRTLQVIAAEADRPDWFYAETGFTIPLSVHYVDAEGNDRVLASQPQHFDASRFSVAQNFAISRDGTRVPYFIVRPVDATGPVAILLNAYGGFRQSMRPGYVGPLPQFWLEQGNGFVLANIRGGGEYGPEWHAAALREKRQNAFDDLHAVAEDLKNRGMASQVAVQGGSNGGLLVGVAYTQRPDLYDAVLMGVPLADMRRYHRLLAGGSWVAEYGNPDDPDDWAFISRYSPYHNLVAEKHYPPVLFHTSTKDDRVHPGHARKMAALMEAQGHRFDYYENIEGGHGGAANSEQAAYQVALMLHWLSSVLPGCEAKSKAVSSSILHR